MQRRVIVTAAVLFVLPSQDASAQGLVQQPVVERVSVGTGVSVPDRGRAFLGGLDSARAVRRDYGPIPWGTATGADVTSRSLDVGVYIHDFESMDAELLAQPAARGRPASIRSPSAAAAWRSLKKNWRRE